MQAVLHFERGGVIQPFLIENKYSLHSNSLEETMIFVTNAFASRINLLPDGTPTNGIFDRKEDSLKFLAESIFHTPKDSRWEDSSWFQDVPGIRFTRFTAMTDLEGRRSWLSVSIADSKVIPDLSKRHPVVELLIKYPS